MAGVLDTIQKIPAQFRYHYGFTESDNGVLIKFFN